MASYFFSCLVVAPQKVSILYLHAKLFSFGSTTTDHAVLNYKKSNYKKSDYISKYNAKQFNRIII